MAKITALKPVWYAGKEHQPGETFEVEEANTVRIWTAVDLPGGPTAELVDKPEPKQKPQPQAPRQEAPRPVQAKVMTAKEPNEENEGEPRKFYRRADMRAEK